MTDFHVITEYHAWFFLLCLAAGAAWALTLYLREHRFDDLPRTLPVLLASLRFVTASLLAFFLLGPMVETLTEETEKPIIVFAQDNSASIALHRDSLRYRNDYAEAVRRLADELGGDYDVRLFSFGERLSDGLKATFDEKQTDFSDMLDGLYNRFSNRNVGAVVIASDGICNRGLNPLYQPSMLPAPVYTVALGDTSVHRDLVMSSVNYNKLVYLGNRFPLEALVLAKRCTGETYTLTVTRNGQKLFSGERKVTGENQSAAIPVILEATEKGTAHYRVAVSRLTGEVSYDNNVFDVFIDVIDSRQKILIVAASPHPDIAALRVMAAANPNYEVTTALIGDVAAGSAGVHAGGAALEKYSLIVLHRLPVKGTAQAVFRALQEEMVQKSIPALYILGASSDLRAFNELRLGLRIAAKSAGTDDVHTDLNPGFSLFTLSDELKGFIRKLPPVRLPFGEYHAEADIAPVLTQRIGVVSTGRPLLFFAQEGNRKWGVLAGEGLWRWRLRDHAANGSHALFNELTGKTMQYLALKVDKSRFRVSGRSRYGENEAVVFEAELYNESYEAVNEAEVKIQFTDAGGKSYPFTFRKTTAAYRLNAGQLPSGTYSYRAFARHGSRNLSAAGTFIVEALHVEAAATEADHGMLYRLAERSGGEMVYRDDLSRLAQMLRDRDDIRAVTYRHRRLLDAINLEWLLILLLLTLAAEWMVRKRSGVY